MSKWSSVRASQIYISTVYHAGLSSNKESSHLPLLHFGMPPSHLAGNLSNSVHIVLVLPEKNAYLQLQFARGVEFHRRDRRDPSG